MKEMSSQMNQLQQRCEDTERYSSRWNLRLYGMRKTLTENIKEETMKLLAALASEDREKMGFLVDTVHKVGVPHANSARSIIVQFTVRCFRDKMSRNNSILKEMKLQLK